MAYLLRGSCLPHRRFIVARISLSASRTGDFLIATQSHIGAVDLASPRRYSHRSDEPDPLSTLRQLRELVFASSLCLSASDKAYHLHSANSLLIRTSVQGIFAGYCPFAIRVSCWRVAVAGLFCFNFCIQLRLKLCGIPFYNQWGLGYLDRYGPIIYNLAIDAPPPHLLSRVRCRSFLSCYEELLPLLHLSTAGPYRLPQQLHPEWLDGHGIWDGIHGSSR